ncbi:CDP-glucose 4,6-dehydratase [Candidatus Pelagibacter sp.]|nr:CDP-glucose 4,6-dehydratase [Candidatus Pelagibacter sp.]
MHKDFWKNKKVLITGHTGFKGSWLSNILMHYGARVFGYALKPNNQFDLYNLTKLKKNLKGELIGDILNFNKFKSFVKVVKPEIVFHLAAQPFVRRSYKIPYRTYQTNCIGTLNVLECCRNLPGLKSVLIITTDKVYNNTEKKRAFSEKDILGGKDPYSSSKAIAELISKCYGLNYYNIKNNAFIATARAGNVIGGGDWGEDRLIPDLIKNLKKNKTTKIRNPNSIRPWQHIFDVLNAYLTISENLYRKNTKALGSWNIGPNTRTFCNVLEIIQKFKKFIPKIKYNKNNNKKEKLLKESKILILNNRKLKNTFGNLNKINTNEMVKLTSSWYSHYLNERNTIKDFTTNQIKQYFD